MGVVGGVFIDLLEATWHMPFRRWFRFWIEHDCILLVYGFAVSILHTDARIRKVMFDFYSIIMLILS